MKRICTPVVVAALVAGCASSETMPPHNNLPHRLPAAVARVLGAVASLEFPAQPDFGSAVRIKFGPSDYYLSAGHLIMNGNNTPKAGSTTCGAIQLEASSNLPDITEKVGNHTLHLLGSTLLATASSGSYVTGDTSSTPDIALLQTNVVTGNPPDTLLPEIASTKPEIGSDVFFVNYEPVTNSLLRSPNQSLIPADVNQRLYSQPAIYGGIVTSYQPNGNYIVTDGLKSYGAVPQTVSRSGASGGAALNAKGQLIGISTELNRPSEQPYTIVQPVSEQLVANLVNELANFTC